MQFDAPFRLSTQLMLCLVQFRLCRARLVLLKHEVVFSSGPIPAALGNLTALVVLDLHGNQLCGEQSIQLRRSTRWVSSRHFSFSVVFGWLPCLAVDKPFQIDGCHQLVDFFAWASEIHVAYRRMGIVNYVLALSSFTGKSQY